MGNTSNEEEATIRHSVWYKKIPTMLTIGNSLCGFSAILYCLQVYEKTNIKTYDAIFATCAWIIVCAMVFDALDGWSARKLKATSLHGLQMDSLADMVTFGATPAVVVAISAHFSALHEKNNLVFDGLLRYDRLVWACCAIYLACAASRLAFYNVVAMEENDSDGNFSGLPSPGAAAGVCTIIIMNTSSVFAMPEWLMTVALPIYTAFLGILMVSSIPYPHMAKWLAGPSKRLRKMIVLAIVGIMFFVAAKITLAAIVTLYILSGPLVYLLKKITGKKVQEDSELEELL